MFADRPFLRQLAGKQLDFIIYVKYVWGNERMNKLSVGGINETHIHILNIKKYFIVWNKY